MSTVLKPGVRKLLQRCAKAPVEVFWDEAEEANELYRLKFATYSSRRAGRRTIETATITRVGAAYLEFTQ